MQNPAVRAGAVRLHAVQRAAGRAGDPQGVRGGGAAARAVRGGVVSGRRSGKSERYPMFHITSPGRLIPEGISIEDLYLPIEERKNA